MINVRICCDSLIIPVQSEMPAIKCKRRAHPKIFCLNVTKRPFRFVIIYRGEMYLREVLVGDIYDFFDDDGYRYTGK